MSLEQAIAENTAAIRDLIVAMGAKGSVTVSTEKTTDTKSDAKSAKGTTSKSAKGSTKKPEVVDPDTLKAKLVEFKGLTNLESAKALTKKLGYAAIGDVPEEESKAVYDAIQEAINDLDSGNTADAEEDEGL